MPLAVDQFIDELKEKLDMEDPTTNQICAFMVSMIAIMHQDGIKKGKLKSFQLEWINLIGPNCQPIIKPNIKVEF